MNNRSGIIEADLGGKEYIFKLDLAGIMEVQKDCDAGPYVVFDRLVNNTFRMEDIRSVIKNGLIGGGLSPNEAMKLVRQYVDPPRPIIENLSLAIVIMNAALVGAPEEDDIKKSEAGEEGISPPR